MDVLGPLGHATRKLFAELVEEEKLNCSFRQDGHYEIYLTEGGLRLAQHEVDLVRRYGYHPELLSGEELRRREPAISKQVVGGVYHPQGATLNPHHFVLELAERARLHGAQFQTQREVVEIVTDGNRVRGVRTRDSQTIAADTVVLAPGVYGTRLIRQLGLRFPLQPAKGYHRDRKLAEGGTPPLQIACLLGETAVYCTPMEGFVRFAGTLELSGMNHKMRRGRLEQLGNAAKRYLSGIRDAGPQSEWCGLRPCMPDGLPVLGPVARYGGLFIATGHAMMGLTLGPITGKLVAEYVLDGAPSMDVGSLSPERF
jgi:D-amino-acid dehydrogenase